MPPAESFDLLDPKEEEELFKTRLLNVEEKSYKRITKRLLPLHTEAYKLIGRYLAAQRQQQDGSAETTPLDADPSPTDLVQLREDITLDFANFDASMHRLQLLFSANERERARYANDRVDIQTRCQAVRDNTSALRAQLDDAGATLQQRKKFDELADKITSNRNLRPRAEQAAGLRKLEDECRALEAESETVAATWRERKEQFARIMDESERLRRLIRDEKEEVERREGMDDEGGAAEDDKDAGTPRPGTGSGHATPTPESGMIPKVVAAHLDNGAATPRPASTFGGNTPARESPGPDGESLKPRPKMAGSFSRNGSQALSRDVSPNRGEQSQRDEPEEGEDVEMDDSLQPTDTQMERTRGDATPRIVLDSQQVDGEQMDTT